MHLDSAREVKRALLASIRSAIVERDLDPAAGEQDLDSTAGRRGGPVIAVGIAPRPGGDYALAVRLRDDVDGDSLLAQLSEQTHGELDVRTIGVVRALRTPDDDPENLRTRQRPLYPGVSIGHGDVSAGTLGGFVEYDGRVHALSNSHVLANSGQGAVGDPVVQPGIADGGRVPDDQVGTVAIFAPLDPDSVNLTDAALATLDDGIDADPARYPGGAVCVVATEPPADGQVQKIGRTTGLTAGLVTAFEVDGIRVQYDIGVLTFDDQIEIEGAGGEPLSAGGDSGSVIWTTAERAGLGLLFAGSSTGGSNGQGLTYANRLQTVLTEFGARWLGGAPEGEDGR